MAANKYLTITSGKQVLKSATDSSAGVGDAGKIAALDITGKLNANMMPTGFGEDIHNMVASEALAAGDFVNVWDDSGTAKVRKASAADTSKPAHGFVKAGAILGGSVDVYFEGGNDQLSSLTPGVEYYLSASTPGAATATPPATVGNVIQRLGVAVNATTLNLEAAFPPVEIAA